VKPIDFDEAIIKIGRIEIKSDGLPRNTHIKFDGKETNDIERMVIIIDAYKDMVEIYFKINPLIKKEVA